MKKTKSNIKGGTAPTFDGTKKREIFGDKWCAPDEIVRADARSQEGLVRVAHCGVGNQEAFVRTDCLGIFFGTT